MASRCPGLALPGRYHFTTKPAPLERNARLTTPWPPSLRRSPTVIDAPARTMLSTWPGTGNIESATATSAHTLAGVEDGRGHRRNGRSAPSDETRTQDQGHRRVVAA